MVFIYKSKTGYVVSERPINQTKGLGWELINSVSSMETAIKLAEKRYAGFVVDTEQRKAPKVRKKPVHDPNKARKRYNARLQKYFRRTGYKNGPIGKWGPRSVLKYRLKVLEVWRKRPEMYWAIRPDGKQVRIYLPDGKHTLPEGWRFGRYGWKWGSGERPRPELRGRNVGLSQRIKKKQQELEDNGGLPPMKKTED